MRRFLFSELMVEVAQAALGDTVYLFNEQRLRVTGMPSTSLCAAQRIGPTLRPLAGSRAERRGRRCSFSSR
jgi:hypothetical protein